MRAMIIFLFLFLAISVIGCSQQVTPSTITPQKICKEVQIPYEAQEKYTDKEPYETVECHKEEFDHAIFISSCSDSSLLGIVPAIAKCKIRNNENEVGLFMIKAGFACNKGCTNGCYSYASKLLTVYAYGTETFTQTDSNIHIAQDECKCVCEVTDAPTKQICENVVKYRDVTKYRTVIKYRTEEKCE